MVGIGLCVCVFCMNFWFFPPSFLLLVCLVFLCSSKCNFSLPMYQHWMDANTNATTLYRPTITALFCVGWSRLCACACAVFLSHTQRTPKEITSTCDGDFNENVWKKNHIYLYLLQFEAHFEIRISFTVFICLGLLFVMADCGCRNHYKYFISFTHRICHNEYRPKSKLIYLDYNSLCVSGFC